MKNQELAVVLDLRLAWLCELAAQQLHLKEWPLEKAWPAMPTMLAPSAGDACLNELCLLYCTIPSRPMLANGAQDRSRTPPPAGDDVAQ
eukprot:2097166-Pyramimonas_sp.AAC.1